MFIEEMNETCKEVFGVEIHEIDPGNGVLMILVNKGIVSKEEIKEMFEYCKKKRAFKV